MGKGTDGDELLARIKAKHPTDRKKYGVFVSEGEVEKFRRLYGATVSISAMFEEWVIMQNEKKEGKKGKR